MSHYKPYFSLLSLEQNKADCKIFAKKLSIGFCTDAYVNGQFS